ncbi:MAG: phosphoribosylglycinamide formyltransferase [Hyphomonadaceae bacterium]|nr:phosphoribosylglycinamide formyltransferase [Hyphomonadaceae bacterium]
MTGRRVGVLISGGGSNLQALLDAQGPYCPYAIAVVIANRPDAGGLERARAAGVEALVVDHRHFGGDRSAFERAIDAALRARAIDLVALAGFMRILTPAFVRDWAGRLLNIHPSLLPAFPGLQTHARALDAGVKLHGCSVHWVSEGVDEGPIIGQAAVPVLPDDTTETLGARVLTAEHVLYPACLALVCADDEERREMQSRALILNAWKPG